MLSSPKQGLRRSRRWSVPSSPFLQIGSNSRCCCLLAALFRHHPGWQWPAKLLIMAQGKPSDCEILPTRDSRQFHFRVRLSSPEDPPAGRSVHATTVIAGCKCVAIQLPPYSSRDIVVNLMVRDNPVLDGDVKVSTHMVFLDKTGSPAPSMGIGSTADDPVAGFMAGGYFLRAGRDLVKANCVVDNYFVVLCSVDINWTPPASSVEEELLPSLGHHLAVMSDEQDLTDVSFDVGGESFSAHRLVLASRSPVFRAELYGPMAEGRRTPITIQDMEASTFRSMLHFMYHGSLPDANVASAVAEYQHLLVAADRYAVEGLKTICECKLCGIGITTDSVVSMLELAEDHVCPKLKAGCLDFLDDGDNFKIVATSAEYLHLMQNFPSLLVEVRDRFKIPHHEKPSIMDPGSHKRSRAN